MVPPSPVTASKSRTGGDVVATKTTTGTNLTDHRTRSRGATYNVTVTATNAIGTSAPSTPKTVTLPVPVAPTAPVAPVPAPPVPVPPVPTAPAVPTPSLPVAPVTGGSLGSVVPARALDSRPGGATVDGQYSGSAVNLPKPSSEFRSLDAAESPPTPQQ